MKNDIVIGLLLGAVAGVLDVIPIWQVVKVEAAQQAGEADRLAARVRRRQKPARVLVWERVLPESAAADADCWTKTSKTKDTSDK